MSCLADVPEVLQELRVNVSRLNTRPPSAAPVRVAGSWPPLPIDERAHECLSSLTLLLRTAVLFFRGAGVHLPCIVEGPPAGLAAALYAATPALAHVEGVGVFADKVAGGLVEAWGVIDLPPEPTVEDDRPAWLRVRESVGEAPDALVTTPQVLTIFPTLNKPRLRQWRKRGIVAWDEQQRYRLGDVADAVALMDCR